MAARVFLLSVLFTVGLSTFRSSEGLEVGLGFASEPVDAVVSRNKPLLLNCQPSRQQQHNSNSTTSVEWTFNNDLVIPDTRRTILNNGSLYIEKVLHKKSSQGVSDIGVYRCLVRNSYGALLSRPAHVRLASIGREFAESPANVSAVPGDAVRLQCHIESTPLPQITWERNSHPLPQNNRYITLNSGILIIRSVDSSDEGEYRCIGTNEILNKVRRHSAVGQLTVRPRSSSLFSSSSSSSSSPVEVEFVSPVELSSVKRVVEGGTVSLDCVVRGRNIDVTWTYKLPNQTAEFVSEAKRSVNVLTLHNVTAQHEGAYTCTAIVPDRNDRNDDAEFLDELPPPPPPLTRLITLEVLSPPHLVKKPKSQVYPTAKTVRIECEAKGNPLPEIVWLKNGQNLRINGRVSARNQSLVMSNSVSDDSGMYQCMLNNSVGWAAAAVRVLVNVSSDQPTPPTNLHCQATSASQVRITWQQPTTKQVQAYTVHYLPTDGGEEMRTVSLNRTFTVSNLLPFTNYTFYIRAYGTKSASDQSQPVTCLTGEEVPVGVPEVEVVSENPTSLRVMWTPLSSKLARGRISEYKIQWRRNDHHSTNNLEHVKQHVTQYLITGLQPGTEYEVRVMAATDQGWPDLPEEAMPWTLVQTLPLQPLTPLPPMPSLQLSVLNATTILVKWSMEPVQQKLDGFHLSYRKQNGELLGPELIDSSITEHLLADLEPQTWYEVVMSGIWHGVEGLSAVRSIQTWAPVGAELETAFPLLPPINLLAEPIAPTAINLTWTPPPSPNPPNVSHYTLSYHVVQTALPLHNSSIYFLNSTSTGVQITGLKAYTLYELKVRTNDENNRHSEYSQKLECRTLEDLPGAVHDVQWKLLNTTTVRISWKEPVKVNGVIANYTLAYSSNPNDPLTNWTKTVVPGTKLSTNLTSLKNNRYTMKIWASTGAGAGPPAPRLEFTIPSKIPNGARGKHAPKPDQSAGERFAPNPDQFLGIVIGCVIGASCIILCTVLLVYRHKCTKPGPVCRTGQTAANGSTGFYLPPSTAFDEMHEMECFTGHLDTKGGFPQDQVNGLKLTLLTNGRIPNGHATRERDHGVRITENPQFNSPIGNLSPGSCDGMRVASDEGDSLLSGHQDADADAEEEGDVDGDGDGDLEDCRSLNDTQLTTLDCCHHQQLQQPHHLNHHHQSKAEQATMIADDDGFHENETHRHHHLIMLGPNG